MQPKILPLSLGSSFILDARLRNSLKVSLILLTCLCLQHRLALIDVAFDHQPQQLLSLARHDAFLGLHFFLLIFYTFQLVLLFGDCLRKLVPYAFVNYAIALFVNVDALSSGQVNYRMAQVNLLAALMYLAVFRCTSAGVKSSPMKKH